MRVFCVEAHAFLVPEEVAKGREFGPMAVPVPRLCCPVPCKVDGSDGGGVWCPGDVAERLLPEVEVHAAGGRHLRPLFVVRSVEQTLPSNIAR